MREGADLWLSHLSRATLRPCLIGIVSPTALSSADKGRVAVAEFQGIRWSSKKRRHSGALCKEEEKRKNKLDEALKVDHLSAASACCISLRLCASCSRGGKRTQREQRATSVNWHHPLALRFEDLITASLVAVLVSFRPILMTCFTISSVS